MSNLRLFYVITSLEDVFVMSHTYDEALGMANKYLTQKNKTEKLELQRIKEFPFFSSESFIKNPKLFKCIIREGFMSNESLYILSQSYEDAALCCELIAQQRIFDADNSLIKKDDYPIKAIENYDIINYELGLEVVYDRV